MNLHLLHRLRGILSGQARRLLRCPPGRQRPLRLEPLEERNLLTTTLASATHPSLLAPSDTAIGSSVLGANSQAQFTSSADGRYIAFSSTAGNLVSGFDLPADTSQIYRYDRLTQEVILVSVNAAGSGGGNSSSEDPTISADGMRVAFVSRASNLHPLDTDATRDVYVRDLRTSPTTLLASVRADGTVKGNSDSFGSAISADGNRVVFVSQASNLDPLDTDGVADIYVREMDASPTTILVNVNAAGTAKGNAVFGNLASPVISADGTRIAFVDLAKLDPLDTDSFQDVYVRELDATPTTFLVNVPTGGTTKGNRASNSPAMSADGTRVAFVTASNLHPVDTDGLADVYVRELDATPVTILIELNAAGSESGNGQSEHPAISADGTRVAFLSQSTNLNPLDTDANYDVYVRDLTVSNLTFLASVSADGTVKANGANLPSAHLKPPAISSDGMRVAFVSKATNLDPLDTDALMDVYVRELDATPTTFLASMNSAGTAKGNENSYAAMLSASGAVVGFSSDASNLVAADLNGSTDVLLRDLTSATIEAASRSHAPPVVSNTGNGRSFIEIFTVPTAPSDGTSRVAQQVTSADGRYTVFRSGARDLVPGLYIPANTQQIYRFDRQTREVTLISMNAAGTGGADLGASFPSISADGTRVAFRSASTNLHPLDTDELSDIYVRDLRAAPTTILASVNAAGTVKGVGPTGGSDLPLISSDGSRVVFLSLATNLDPLDTDTLQDVYVRVLDGAPTTILASVNAAGTAKSNGNSYYPTLSDDGRRVAFMTFATNFSPLDTDPWSDIYVRDLGPTPTTILASVNAAGTVKGVNYSIQPVISGDGLRVAFSSISTNLSPLDTDTLTDIYVRELDATPTTFLVSVNAAGTVKGNGHSWLPSISTDGTRIAFVSAASNLTPLDIDATTDIYVRELDATPTTYLASVNSSGTAKGNGPSSTPVLSASGKSVAFVSTASNLHPLDADTIADIYVRTLDGPLATNLASVNTAGSVKGNFASDRPAISADGNVVVFNSGSSNLVANDLNGATDVFLWSGSEPPQFTSSSAPAIAENTTAVVALAANDPDSPPQSITFSITGGADAARFTIASGNQLQFAVAPNFEAPVDADGNNVYLVQVTADDGAGGSAVQAIAVTVLNVAPTVATAAAVATNPVLDISTTLSVLGAEGIAEGNLSYTWNVINKPAGAADPSFTPNGTAAAKASIATFLNSGSYTLRATISDGATSVTSDISFVVDIAPAQNHSEPFDVNSDGVPNLLDLVDLIGLIVDRGTGPAPIPQPTDNPKLYPDVNGDRQMNTLDLIDMINFLVTTPPPPPPATPPPPAAMAVSPDRAERDGAVSEELLLVLATDVSEERRRR